MNKGLTFPWMYHFLLWFPGYLSLSLSLSCSLSLSVKGAGLALMDTVWVTSNIWESWTCKLELTKGLSVSPVSSPFLCGSVYLATSALKQQRFLFFSFSMFLQKREQSCHCPVLSIQPDLPHKDSNCFLVIRLLQFLLFLFCEIFFS